jgi:hypothetical protein
MLLLMNSDQRATADQGFYYQWAQFGEPGDWAGADLLAGWFRRNIRIYTNVMQLIDSSSERVLVIFGAGHLGWLRYDFASNPNIAYAGWPSSQSSARVEPGDYSYCACSRLYSP